MLNPQSLFMDVLQLKPSITIEIRVKSADCNKICMKTNNNHFTYRKFPMQFHFVNRTD